jgi:hypothetical protein
MNQIVDLNAYRQAKVIVAEITELITTLRHQNEQLMKYHKYVPVQTVAYSILDSIAILTSHLKYFQDVIDKKGVLNDTMEKT